MRCPSCGIIFLSPPLDHEAVRRLYSRDYYQHDFRCGYAESCFDTARHDRLVDHSLLAFLTNSIPRGKLLEIGCAGGVFLNAARASGFDVQGVELSSAAADFARATFQIPVVTGTVIDARFPDRTFDGVVMADVLEHLPNPVETLEEVWRIMRQGGLLVILSPTQTNTLFSRIGLALYGLLGKNVTIQLPPYHLFEYRPSSLRNLLHRTGFHVVKESRGTLPPGSVMLRGPALQKIGKKLFQYVNYGLTEAFGILGDRITVYAIKHDARARS